MVIHRGQGFSEVLIREGCKVVACATKSKFMAWAHYVMATPSVIRIILYASQLRRLADVWMYDCLLHWPGLMLASLVDVTWQVSAIYLALVFPIITLENACKSWILSKHANRSPMHRTPQPMPFVPTVESTNTSCTKPALCKVDVPKIKAIWPYSTFLSVLWVVPLSASAHLLARPQALKAAFTPHLHQNCFVPKQHRYITSSIRPKCDCCCRFRLKTKKCLHGFLFRKSTTVHAPRLYEQH